MTTVTIYALVDPRSHQVKYVGQSRDPERRLSGHVATSVRGTKPVHAWLRGLSPDLPVLVILESVVPRIIRVNNVRVQWASVMEAKWLKRHRRTVLNFDKKQCAAYDTFVNSREVNEGLYAQTGPAC